MRMSFVFVVVCLVPHLGWTQQDRQPIKITRQAIEIHEAAPVFDGHNDLPWALRQSDGGLNGIDLRQPQPNLHTDIPRLKQGGVGAQFWSVYVPVSTARQGSALTTTLEQIELVKELTRRYPDVFELALTTQDIDRIRESGKIASLIGVEGGHSIEDSISVLRQLYQAGARYMTLTHSMSLDWADSCSDRSICGGLSPFGAEVVQEMNRLGMLVDLSHVSPECMRKTLRVTRAPVIFSHSSARAIADHPRNVPDDVLATLKDNGGVVMINFFSDYIDPDAARRANARQSFRDQLQSQFGDDEESINGALRKWAVANPRPTLGTVDDVLDHIDHVVRIAGIDHVGLGSDFDGVPALPVQLEHVGTYPVITQGMLDRGYTRSQIEKVLGGNIIRVFREVEAVARSSR